MGQRWVKYFNQTIADFVIEQNQCCVIIWINRFLYQAKNFLSTYKLCRQIRLCQRKAKPGLAMISAQSGIPILPIASTMTAKKRLKSWDRMILPVPFTQVILSFGELIQPPESLDRACIREKTLELETKLNELQEQLESTYQIDAQLTPPN